MRVATSVLQFTLLVVTKSYWTGLPVMGKALWDQGRTQEAPVSW